MNAKIHNPAKPDLEQHLIIIPHTRLRKRTNIKVIAEMYQKKITFVLIGYNNQEKQKSTSPISKEKKEVKFTQQDAMRAPESRNKITNK